MQAKRQLWTSIKEKLEELTLSAKDLSRTQITIIAALMLALVISAGLNYYKSRPVELQVNRSNEKGKENENRKIAVHVTGAVVKPGLYEVDEGARVSDAVNMAGGPTPEASLDSINLASRVKDGTQIAVPAVVLPVTGDSSVNLAAQNKLEDEGLVNINTADEKELEELPGIGPSYAARIVEYRKTNGPFSSIDELQGVKGIGPKTIEQIEGLVTI
ncbi:MAG: helix-hairpin-helix domain-containing protein [Actinobacteria bacterium]|nr:helix-hairpin-helix domain-containing protein [Actinomycetota bacterium]